MPWSTCGLTSIIRSSIAIKVPLSTSKLNAPLTSAVNAKVAASYSASAEKAVTEVVPETMVNPSLDERTVGSSPASSKASFPLNSFPLYQAFPSPIRTIPMWASREIYPTEPCPGTLGTTFRFNISFKSSSVSNLIPVYPDPKCNSITNIMALVHSSLIGSPTAQV